jgi:hypothetical protein
LSQWRGLRSEFGACTFLIWHMHCFSRAWNKQLWRVAEWLVRKRTLVRRAVVVRPAAAAVLPVAVVDVVAPLEAVADQVAARAAVAVAASLVAVDKAVVVAGVLPVVAEAAAKAVVDKAAGAVDVPAAVVDKVVVEEADAQVAGADPLVVGEEWEEAVRLEAAVVVAQAVEAAEAASPYLSTGRRGFATPRFFIDALHRRASLLAAVDRAAYRHVSPAPSLALAG